jgi:hypothetical protein
MKIYSKFHDYYDSVLKFSQTDEDGVVYERESKQYVFDKNMAEIKSSGHVQYYLNSNLYFIGFCGKIYPVFNYHFEEGESKNFHIGIDNEALIEKIKEYKKRASGRYEYPDSVCLNKLLGIKEQFDWWRNYTYVNPFKLEDFFIKYETPIFVFCNSVENRERKWTLKTNPCLKDFDFQRIVDPYSAFQEISMFFNSTLTNVKTPKMPVGSDVVIAESKGFDKWSFRKMGENSK